MTTSANGDIARLLIEHEESLSGFYSAVERALPAMRSFWSRFSQEEKAHAEVLRMLQKSFEEHKVLLNSRKFNSAAVHTGIEYVMAQTRSVALSGTTPVHALALAIDMESTILEREFFRTFETDSPEMKADFEELAAHTEMHRRILQERLREERARE